MASVQHLHERPKGPEQDRGTALVTLPGEIDLREFGRKLWRRKAVVIFTAVSLTLLAALVILRLTPVYTAKSFVMISERQTQVIDVTAVVSGLPGDAATVESEIEVIRSRDLARKTIAALRLEQDPGLNGALREIGLAARLSELRALLPEDLVILFTGAADRREPSPEETARRRLARVVDAFLDRLDVSQVGRSRVIRISFTSQNAETAARVVNRVAELYIVSQLEAKFEAVQGANEWLSERLAGLKEAVNVSERAVETFRLQSGLIRGKDTTLKTQELSELNTQLVIERTKRAEAEARLRQIEDLLRSGGPEAVSEVLRSDLVEALREQQAIVDREAAELAADYGEKHPKMINIRAQAMDVHKKIDAEVNRILQGLRNEVNVARARESTVGETLDSLREQVGRLNNDEVTLRALEREAEANRTLLETFLERFKETSSQEDFQHADATVISRADVPVSPSSPRSKLLLLASAVVATAIGLMLAIGIEMLDQGFRSMEQIEQLMGGVPLGLVPALKGVGRKRRRPDLQVLERPTSAYSEAIRSLHTSLLLSTTDERPPKTVLVSSGLPEEGKTAVCLSLAHLLASTGQKVVLIDCDLRSPTAHRAFECDSEPGLSDCLLERAPLESVLVTDKKSGCDFIPAGNKVPNPADILGSLQMRNLLGRLAGDYDFVLLDSSPVLAVSDTRVLSRAVDKTIFLVRWARTRRQAATAAYRQLLDAGADIAGIGLTLVDIEKHAQYDFADSGFYYGRIRKYYAD